MIIRVTYTSIIVHIFQRSSTRCQELTETELGSHNGLLYIMEPLNENLYKYTLICLVYIHKELYTIILHYILSSLLTYCRLFLYFLVLHYIFSSLLINSLLALYTLISSYIPSSIRSFPTLLVMCCFTFIYFMVCIYWTSWW